MAQFYWNFIYPTGDRQKAYENYLQNTSYIADINDCITYNNDSIKSLLHENNSTAQNINKGISNICGKLDTGFELLSNHLTEINSGIQNLSSEISALSSLIDWKLSALIEGQRITNNLLGNISNLLKIPDIQKERAYYIEEGLKYLKNALIEQWDSDYFEEAYSAFNEALQREPKDYISLNKIGFIHLFSKQYLDFAKAETFFRKAFRYANAEATTGGTNFTNNLNPLNNDFKIKENMHLVICVESMLYCARACALQNKFNEAIQLTSDAYKKVPAFLNAAYETAKYYCIINDVEKALPLITEIIEKDRFQTIKIIGDPDLISKNEIISLLGELSEQKQAELKEKIEYCEKHKQNNNIFNQIVQDIILSAQHRTYLHSCHAFDIINTKRNWYIKEISYCKKMYEFINNSNEKIYSVESYLDWFQNFSESSYQMYPDDLVVTHKNIEYQDLTLFEFISKSEQINKTNRVIIHRCITHLENRLQTKNIFGIPKLSNTKKENALWLIKYLKSL